MKCGDQKNMVCMIVVCMLVTLQVHTRAHTLSYTRSSVSLVFHCVMFLGAYFYL
jgi:hypothetical protein